MSIEQIARRIEEAAAGNSRIMVGIAGPPGAGKTTFAEALFDHLSSKGLSAKVVPMDGFHLDNVTLDKIGLRQRKGAPQTFDANGFVDLVTALRRNAGRVQIPGFDRVRDCVVENHDEVTTDQSVLLVEGNYLFLGEEPWTRLPGLFDITVFINPGMEELERRLIQRWIDHDHSREDAEKRARQNDIPNAVTVLASAPEADFLIVNGAAD